METAIDAVRSGFMGYFKASRTYGVAKTTLIRRYKGGNKHALGSIKALGRAPDLPKKVEDELYDYVTKMERRFLMD